MRPENVDTSTHRSGEPTVPLNRPALSLGSGPRGVSWDEIDYKYRALMPASGLSSQRIEQSLDAIKRLDEAQGVGALLALLV